jgi:glycosyltransferase involved in cell wall biosynthesis
MKFSFVILTWNRKIFLEKCLSSLLESIDSVEDTEIIVMDNGSTDGTAEFLKQFENHKNFRIVLRDKNYGLNAYKKLIGKAKGDYIVVVDDDVLGFPPNIKQVFESYMTTFKDFGYMALDVIQNEHTNGAKPTLEHYTEVERNGKIVQQGPAGGWCACFRRKDYQKIKLLFWWSDLSMKNAEDGRLSYLLNKWLKLKYGIIKDIKCFHAAGPYYSREYGYLDRDIEKYKISGLDNFVEMYKEYKSD